MIQYKYMDNFGRPVNNGKVDFARSNLLTGVLIVIP